MPPRIDQHGNASRKTLSLFSLLLFTGKEYSLMQLAEILHCSRQTVLRMVEQIERSGEGSIEVRKDGGQNLYRIRTPRQRPRVAVSPEELEHLVLCRDMLAHVLPKGVLDSAKKATNKTATLLENFDTRQQALEPLACAETKGSINYSPFEPLLEALTKAIRQRQVLDILYHSPKRAEPKAHEMVPVRIVAYRESLYVRGWLVTEKGTPRIVSPTMLALHRMKALTPTRRILPDTAQQDLPPLLSPDDNVYFGVAATHEPFAVRVRFFPPAAAYVGERQWSAGQTIHEQGDGSIVLDFTARSEMEVVKWVLGFGREAELLAPIHLHEKIREELQDTLLIYVKKV